MFDTSVPGKIRFLVCRPLEATGAIVTLDISSAFIPGKGTTVHDVKAAVMRALAKWFKTPEGKEALEASVDDFTIFDLASELDSHLLPAFGQSTLSPLLEAEGIYNLTVDCLFDADEILWGYDDLLVRDE
jgi:hypothetical protein